MSSSDWRDEDFQLTHDAIFSLSKVTSVLLNLCMFKFYLNPECIIFQLKCLIGTNAIFSLKCVVFISVYIGTHCLCIYVYLYFNVHFTVKSTQHKNHFNYYYPLLEPKIHVSCKWRKYAYFSFMGSFCSDVQQNHCVRSLSLVLYWISTALSTFEATSHNSLLTADPIRSLTK